MGRHFLLRVRELFGEIGEANLDEATLSDLRTEIARLDQACLKRLEALQRMAPARYGDLIAAAGDQVAPLEISLAELEDCAERDLALLLKLPDEERRLRIGRAHKRFRNPILVDHLVDESYRRVTRDPASAREIAETAHAIALRLPAELIGEAWAVTCIARATAHRGNAIRAGNDIKAAESLLELARTLFHAKGSGDPLIAAEIDYLLASVRRDQRRFAEAEALLSDVIGLYQELADIRGEAEATIKLSSIYAERGESLQALTTIQAVLPKLDRDEYTYLYLCAVHNQAHYLADLERFEECEELLFENGDLYQALAIPAFKIRLRWLLGKVERGKGNHRSAEEAFVAVRDFFVSEGLSFDAALAGLDLALVYVAEGRPGEIRKLAEQMIPIFMAQDIERETIAALMLFQEAARQEAVTDAMVVELSRYMGRARRRPRRLA